MKKYLALLLVLVMALGLFAACGTDEPATTTAPKTDDPVTTTAPVDTTPAPKDPVTLVWYIRGVGTQTDHAKVMEEFNKLLQSYEGFEHITVDVRHDVASEHAATVERAFTAKEQIDIVCTVNLNPVDMARDGYFVGLSQYFDEHTTLWETYPQWLWETQYVDDDYYVVPNYQRGSNPKYWMMRAEDAALCDWEGLCELISWENGYSKGTADEICAKLEEMYLALKAAGKNYYMRSPLALIDGYNQNFYWHEYLTNLAPNGCDVFANNYTGEVNVRNMTEEYKTLWKWSCKWADAGYYPADVTTAESGTYTFSSGAYFYWTDQTMDWDVEKMESTLEAQYPDVGELVICRHVDQIYMENRWAANGNAVSSTCENPEDAVAFLELLNSEAGIPLYNMLVYGLEGEHWEWVDESTNQIKTLHYDGTQASGEAPYGTLKWCVGNTFNAYLNQACSLTENDSALYINENGVTAPYAGIKLDTTMLETEISNMKAVMDEWGQRVNYGMDGEAGFEAAYAELMAALNNAGAQTVIDELQAQIDDYIASKG